jgi:diguanylate cyclase (GGDEF)-like protein
MDQNIRRSIEPADVKKDEVRVFDLDDHYRDLVDKAKDIIHPDSMDQCMEAYNNVAFGAALEGVEAAFIAKDGTVLMVEDNVNVKLDEEGQFELTRGIFHEVTDRKMAEQSLKEREEKYHSLYTLIRLMSDTMPDMLWAKDLKRRYIFANEAICMNLLSARDTEEPVGKTDLFFATREREAHPDNPDWHTFGELCMDSDTITLKEMRPIQFNEFGNVKGQFLYLDVRKAPLFDSNGELIGVVGSARDITESKRVEAELLSREHLQQLLMSMATELVNIKLDTVDAALNKMLEEVGSFSGLDRVYIFINDYEAGITTNTHEWCAKGISPQIDNLKAVPLDQLSDLIEPHERGDIFIVPSTVDMPVDDRIRKIVEPQGIKSLLLIPLMQGSYNIGFVGFDAVREKKAFTETEITLLRVFAGLIANIKERQKNNESLQFQLQYEKMVSDISTYFISLPTSSLDDGINRAIEETGKLFNADRSYVLLFNDEKTHFTVTHECCASGIEPQKERNQEFSVAKVPWWTDKILNTRYVYIEKVEDLPEEATLDKEDFQIEGIKSILAIPLRDHGNVIGAFGYETVTRSGDLDEDHIFLLNVVAEIIANAISRNLAEAKIAYMSFHDQLTGLYNRYFLEEEIFRHDKGRQMPISVIMTDVNGLKLVNDTYGHSVGDEMLKKAAEIMKKSCREEDIIARFGGDEFIIFLPGASEQEAQQISRRIDQAYREEYVEEVPITMSFGVAVKNQSDQKLADVLKEAEDKMYQNKLTESRSGKSAVLSTLLKTLAEKSYETEAHTRNMQEIALKIGSRIGLPDSELNRLNLLITLHDIGKINIPEELLTKKDALSKDEWEVMKKHAETGFRIARATEEFAHVADGILSHHEKWDGTGYPQGLKGKDIPLLARITTIADAFEVMSNGRPYKKALEPKVIIAEFEKCAGTHFDPELVEHFLNIYQVVEKRT